MNYGTESPIMLFDVDIADAPTENKSSNLLKSQKKNGIKATSTVNSVLSPSLLKLQELKKQDDKRFLLLDQCLNLGSYFHHEILKLILEDSEKVPHMWWKRVHLNRTRLTHNWGDRKGFRDQKGQVTFQKH